MNPWFWASPVILVTGTVLWLLILGRRGRQQRQVKARAWGEHVATAVAVSRVKRLPPEPREDIDEVLERWVKEGKGNG